MDSTATLQQALDQLALTAHDPRIVFISGASGAGKTHLVNACQAAFTHPQLKYVYFDQIGVPSVETMQAEFGSIEQWQYAMTLEWVRRFKEEYTNTQLFLFEGQYNFEFAIKACQAYAMQYYQLVLVTVPDDVRIDRLIHLRQQPELASANMLNWARFLENQAHYLQANVIDTDLLTTPQAVDQVFKIATMLCQS